MKHGKFSKYLKNLSNFFVFNKLYRRKTAIQNAENKYVEEIIKIVFVDLILMSPIKMVLNRVFYIL